MKKILLIGTGGTIASVQTEHGLRPGIAASDLLEYISDIRTLCRIDVVQVCNLDSTNMTTVQWTQIVEAIRSHYDDYDGFIVTHGTDTMAYTSAALSYMIQNSRKPIVITGSQKPISSENTDARRNIRDSIRYACSDESQDVSLVFDGNVIAGTRAKKTMAHSFNAFSSVNFPYLARIREDRIIRYIPAAVMTDPVCFTPRVRDSICVMKLVPGSRPELLSYLFANYDCIVIESFGVGGIPDTLREEFYQEMEHWKQSGKCIVMATQVVNEGSDMEIYQVGQQIKEDFGLLEAYDMTLEAVLTKLMWLMAVTGCDYEKMREGFYRQINYDILCGPDLH